MEDHPVFGAVVFVIGAALVGIAYLNSDAGGYTGQVVSFLIGGHILTFNGVLFVFLGCRKIERDQKKRRYER